MPTTPEMQYILAEGTLLQNGEYRIVRQLGVGGFGITYLARHKVFGDVAVKELFLNSGAIYCTRDTATRKEVIPQFEKAQFEAFKERFMSEARTIYALRGIKGVVKVLHFFEENGTVYYAMEYLEGENLDKYVRDNHPIAEPIARRIINSIGETLAAVHSNNVLHCDVKPANIIISSDGQVTLIDFGIARTFQVENDGTHTTIHSPRYSPPEQKISKARMGTFSDVYAFGATAYYIFTGEPPQNLEELTQDGYRSPRFFRYNIPEAVEEVITKSMVIKADERLPTIDAFLQIFNQPVQQNEPARITIKKGIPRANQALSSEADGTTRADLSSLSSSNINEPAITQLDVYAKNKQVTQNQDRTQILQDDKKTVFNKIKVLPKSIWWHERKIILVGIVALVLLLIMLWAISRPDELKEKTISTAAPVEKPQQAIQNYSTDYITAKKTVTIGYKPALGLKYLRRAAMAAILTGNAEKLNTEIDADFFKTEENDLLKLYNFNTKEWDSIRNALINKDTSKLPIEKR